MFTKKWDQAAIVKALTESAHREGFTVNGPISFAQVGGDDGPVYTSPTGIEATAEIRPRTPTPRKPPPAAPAAAEA